jgi:NAD(P)-dependent dehydrogenase (short-subunit alcohol dehydrogenase family)
MTGAHPRTAVVTGADSGIGRAVAQLLATEGFDVGITFHTDEAGAHATREDVEQRGQRGFVVQQDLASPQAAEPVEELADRLGSLGVLVNCGGTGTSQPAVDMTFEDWRKVVATDLDGPFLCARAAARRMIAQGEGGRIINITSVHEHAPRVGSGAYCAAKGGLGLLTKVMAQELAAAGITVNAVAPGEIATEMTGNEDVDPHTVDRPGIPAGRPGDANEVAAVVAMLAGPAAAYVTGASYVVDGGMLLMGPQAGSHLTAGEWRNG